MEMDADQMNHYWNSTEYESSEQSCYAVALGLLDAYRDHELLPQIGDNFQAEIPPLMTKSSYLLLTGKANDAALRTSTCHDFLVGLPISLMWIKDGIEDPKHEPQEFPCDLNGLPSREGIVKFKSITERQIFSGTVLHVKNEPADIFLGSRLEVREPQHEGKGYRMVPGSFDSLWSDLEEASFLLGLYIFGKNLVQVKKFVGSKNMGDILSLYYGKFYGSDRYKKWADCRKQKSKKCIYGQRIFVGSAHHILLSRLYIHAPEERKNALMEVAKMYGEGKLSVDEYVFSLKATVGMSALVAAVAIGKGKEDLTGMTTDPLKSNHVVPARPEIPVGKACSTLTPWEIVNFLTGGYRLSKARSNDLFWEAVWPRLLARGWHSEQPKDHSFAAASRNSLVFLIPGIKKFSRRKLVKGNHYFDSVSDVLNKVASDPALLELDLVSDNGNGRKREENGWTDDKVLDGQDFSDQQRHCYLKPRTPSRSTDVIKFTVVDTSVVNGEKTKVRELKRLPAEIKMNISISRSDSEESDDDSSEATADESDSSDYVHFQQNKNDFSKPMKINDATGHSNFSGMQIFENNALKQSFPVMGSCFNNVQEEQNDNKYDDMQPRKPVSGQTIKRTKKPTDKKNLLAPSNSSDFQENVHSQMGSIQTKFSSTSSSSRGSPNNNTDECTISSNSSEKSQSQPQPRTLIDLNLPVPQVMETESFMMEMTEQKQDDSSDMLKTSASSVCDSTSEQPSSMNYRRHSTRNRPLTTKALEALACGFLTVKQKRSRRDDFALDSRPSRRARSRVRMNENFVMDFEGEEQASGVCKNNGEMFSELPV